MKEQILIFRTSVRNARNVKHIAALFALCPQICRWNVDMEDWEEVLRIECQGVTPTEILEALRAINIYAQELERKGNALLSKFTVHLFHFHSSIVNSICMSPLS